MTVARVRFPALDGYSLGGFLHVGSGAAPRHAVVFATGGGIRAEVYRHFLSYLASHGIAVLAFDYRGIGESRPLQLRGFVAGFEDWAEYDAGGAIAWMAQRYPTASLTGMGHSIGALMIGAADAASQLSQLVLICPHTGYFGDYHPHLRGGVWLCWRLLGPLLRQIFGYFPASKLGFGEDLPDRIAEQWGNRTEPHFGIERKPDVASRQQQILDRIRRLRKPAIVISRPMTDGQRNPVCAASCNFTATSCSLVASFRPKVSILVRSDTQGSFVEAKMLRLGRSLWNF